MRDTFEARSTDRTPARVAKHSMKSPTRHSPVKGGSHSHSSASHAHHHPHIQMRTHSPSKTERRPSEARSGTTPTTPRMACSVGQDYFPRHQPASPNSNQKSSSPNYFGLVVEQHGTGGSSGLVRHGPSPSSSLQSFGTAIPQAVPLDGNPEFEAFRKQVDLNKGKSFAFPTSHLSIGSSSTPVRPRPSRWHTHSTDSRPGSFVRQDASKPATSSKMDVDSEGPVDSAYVSAESKANSESSLLPKPDMSIPKFDSPRQMEEGERRTTLTRAEDKDPRLSMMEHRLEPPPLENEPVRARTLPAPLHDDDKPSMINGSRLKELIKTTTNDRILILDIRSTSNFGEARVEGALNLCIPTTLLKRATYNTQKLQSTFQRTQDADKFSCWKDADWIVVYDSHSSDKKDAVTAQNMIKKFSNEGYTGRAGILRGGFSAFYDQFPELIDDESLSGAGPMSSSLTQKGSLAPVIGGVAMPKTENDANPFFSNIRQNMDLADGVGQFDVATPFGIELNRLPEWLRHAAAEQDHGKDVSDKFLSIEREEQSRMRSAYAAFNTAQPRTSDEVQLCGVEKGVKNRYNNILPFDHARVKLQHRGADDCDYINASHLQASRSNKRYIATQGPLPATFNDFWSVVWEQDVRVIVMLTAETEGGQLKCHSYWTGREYGPIRLRMLSEKKTSLDIDRYHPHPANSHADAGFGDASKRASASSREQTPSSHSDAPYVLIRKFAMSHSGHPFEPIREITHLHFAAWPDFGTPAKPSHLLALVELANVTQYASLPVATASVIGSRRQSGEDQGVAHWYDQPERDPEARPLLVHCSAGCGRTGTFCTVDSVIDMMKRRQVDAAERMDAEGDTAMADSLSPRSAARDATSPTPQKRRKSMGKKSYVPSAIDTSFVRDEAVDLIQRTVEDLREQRLSMVQSLRQFVLCYETVLEWAHRSQSGHSTPMLPSRIRSGSVLTQQKKAKAKQRATISTP